MRYLLTAISLSACLTAGAIFGVDELPATADAAASEDLLIEADFAPPELAEPPTDAAGCLLAVQQAWDPATAEDAYQRGIAAGADRLTINQSYVREMISLGLPGQAEEAAEQILDVFPQDGVAWAVLAYADAARNDTTAALAEMATAVDWAPDDPFVQGVAGKLMAWYRFPGLGDPSELPDGLPERLDQIHAQLITREAYRVAFEAAYAYYQSQANAAIPEYPQAIVEPVFEQIAYTPAAWTTYNEYVYSGFTVPCFSVSWLVPRVGCYVIHDRHVHRHLRFHIGDRCGRYHGGFHATRLYWERTRRCAAYHVAGRIRLGARAGLHLPPVHARYTKAMFSSRPAAPLSALTNPPPPAPQQVVHRLSASRDRIKPDYARTIAPPVRPRIGAQAHTPGSPSSVQPKPPAGVQAPPQPKPGSMVEARHDPKLQPRTQALPPAPRIEPKPEVKPQPRPELKPQPSPAPSKIDPKHQPQPEARPLPTPEAKPQPKPEVRPQSKPEVKPQSKSEVKPLPKSQASRSTPKIEPKPEVKPPPKPDVKPQPSPAPARIDPKPQPKPEAKPQPKPEPRPQPKAEPKPQPRPTPPAPKVEPKPQPSPPPPRAEPKPQPPPQQQPKANPKPQPPHPKAEPKPQPPPPPAPRPEPPKAPPGPQTGQPQKSGRK